MPNALILGASRGLGAAITKECVQRGWETTEIASSYTVAEKCFQGRKQIRCDLAQAESVKDVAMAIGMAVAVPDHFFWVAGQHWVGPFENQSDESVQHLIDVNLRNPLLLIKSLWLQMLCEKSPATFTVIASTSGVQARKNETVYTATKHAQVGFARSLGLEAQGTLIRVCLVLPGGMDTTFFANKLAVEGAPLLDPAKVANHIMVSLDAQRDSYQELTILRGSL